MEALNNIFQTDLSNISHQIIGVDYANINTSTQCSYDNTISTMAGYFWVDSNVRAPLPQNAVEGGRDSDGTPIYVGLASHRGEELPAKVMPRKHAAYVCVNGNEVSVTNYKILVQKSLQWVRGHGNQIPPDAVPAGHTMSRETLYVGRAHHAGSLTVGKVHPSHGVVYIPYGGKEHGYRDYEILVYR